MGIRKARRAASSRTDGLHKDVTIVRLASVAPLPFMQYRHLALHAVMDPQQVTYEFVVNDKHIPPAHPISYDMEDYHT